MSDWHRLARALAEELAGQGALTPEWSAAFEQTPRHLFVPRFYTLDNQLIDGDDPDNRAAWLTAVYSDESLITQVRTAPGTDLAWPTSSSTRPSLMARMLGLLDVVDGQQVLEIGTGTGYNAALLCHRLGDTHVTSIDIDPTLVAAARSRLAELGFRPQLVAGDGADGVPTHAPYHRIIATCGVPTIPPDWIRQLADDGIIVADVRGEIASNLIAVRKVDPHAVRGRFLASAGHFMWLRPQPNHPLRQASQFSAVYDFTDPHTDTAQLPLAAFDDPDFRFVLETAVPGLGPIGHKLHDGREGILIVGDGDPSWLEISADPSGAVTTRYGGPRLLWPDVADAWFRWRDWGYPTRDRFGLTAHDDGRQHVWLDEPGNRSIRLGPDASAPRAVHHPQA